MKFNRSLQVHNGEQLTNVSNVKSMYRTCCELYCILLDSFNVDDFAVAISDSAAVPILHKLQHLELLHKIRKAEQGVRKLVLPLLVECFIAQHRKRAQKLTIFYVSSQVRIK